MAYDPIHPISSAQRVNTIKRILAEYAPALGELRARIGPFDSLEQLEAQPELLQDVIAVLRGLNFADISGDGEEVYYEFHRTSLLARWGQVDKRTSETHQALPQ